MTPPRLRRSVPPPHAARTPAGSPARLGPGMLALAAVCYVPLLLTAPGRVSADTKTYLYLDPGGLLARATAMWDTKVALGLVPHQQIGFLWPMGPFFWFFDALGVPDWVAQRLWWATLMFAAGAGVAVLLRRFGWRAEAIWAGAAVYALSPYVLTLLGRLSGVLLPYAALPWLVVLTFLAARSRGWRHPALFALVAATAGAVNLTALVLVGLAPLAVLAHLVWVAREVPRRDALLAAGRIAVLTLLVSAWSLAGLAVQASHGNDVLRYSETAELVAETSTANEVLRGLGYWLFYGEDRVGPWIEPSTAYTQSPGLLALTYGLPVLGLLGAALARWRHRALFVALVVTGLLVAIGPYPWDDPPPLGAAIKALLLTDRGLALRSLPRAVPVLTLGLATLAAAGLGAVLARRPALGRALAGTTIALAVLALPPLWTGRLVPTNLDRPGQIPEHWQEAAGEIDRSGTDTRVLEIPGADFGAYRWGYTVDPVTPGLVERDVAYRELIPFGPPESARLLIAADQAFQDRVAEPEALAAVARLLRAGHLVVRNDLEHERFLLPPPTYVWGLVQDAPGLGMPVGFGDATAGGPVPRLEDDLALAAAADRSPPPAVAVVPVEGAVPLLAAHATTSPVLLAGDGFGIVDAAGAGLIDGSELIRFSAGLDPGDVAAALDDGAVLLVTDTNRARGQRWSSIRDSQGYTETEGHQPLEVDHGDNRLPFFDGAGDDARTVVVHRGGISARATSYGNPTNYFTEHRPANAVDGDPTTAWRTASFADGRGERLLLTLDEPVTAGHIELLQPPAGTGDRHLTEVRLRFDGRHPVDVELEESSRSEPGQRVTFDPRTFTTLEIEIVADSAGPLPRYFGQGAVGFAEVRIGSDAPVLDEWVRLPVDLLRAAGPDGGAPALAVVMTRLRADPTDVVRDDEERRLSRLLELPTARTFTVTGTARISGRAPDHLVDAALGRGPADTGPDGALAEGTVRAASDGRLGGSRSGTGADALDGDPATAWRSPRGPQAGRGITVEAGEPITVDRLDLVAVDDGRHAVPTRLAVGVPGEEPVIVDLPVDPGVDGADRDRISLATAVDPPVEGRVIRVEVLDVRAPDPGGPIDGAGLEPVGIAELGIPGVVLPPLPDDLDTGCRDDLVTIDDRPVPVRITGSLDDARRGGQLAVTGCEPSMALPAGERRIRTADGTATGIDIDRLVLRSPDTTGPDATGPDATAPDATGPDTTGPDATGPDTTGLLSSPAPRPDVEVLAASSTRWVAEVRGPPGEEVWIVLGQSFNEGWQARTGDTDLGRPQLVDGFANGWRVPIGADGLVRVEIEFGPQRFVNLALATSALAALGCLLLVWRGRPAPAMPDARPEPVSTLLVGRYEGALPSMRRAVLVGLAVAAVGALVVPLLLAGVLGLAAGWACRHDGARGPLVMAGPALAALAGAVVVVQQVRHGIAPGIEWVAEHRRAHLLALAAVLVLAVDTVVDRAWRRPNAGDGEPSRRRWPRSARRAREAR